MTPSERKTRRPELLAPAGSLDSFFAAIESGADAVYVGLRRFSARARARNFDTVELARMAALCRREGRRLYVTVNTLIKERELPEIVDLLTELSEIRPNALIVQDLGLAAVAREHFPSMPLHASTQMTVHGIDGVRRAAALGFRRVVLARELSLPGIRSIACSSPVEIEVFVHGALCFCLSGQCLFSSFLGGRSGNRGDCAQPCRRRYRMEGGREYPFSTRDLWGLDAVQALEKAGVASLKIEGRMKPADHVAAVVSAYRTVLDAPPGRIREAREEAFARLSRSLGREGTAGFLVEGPPRDVTAPERQGAVGRSVGRIERADAAGFSLLLDERVHAGDRLRVIPANDREGRSFTVRRVLVGGQEGTVAQAGVLATIPAPFRFASGDRVYKVSVGDGDIPGEAACRRRLASIPAERISCNLELSLTDGLLSIRGASDAAVFEAVYPIAPLESSRRGGVSEILRARFAETGDSPFALAAFDASLVPEVFIPPSRLKEIRRLFYEAFAREVVRRKEEGRETVRGEALQLLAVAPRGGAVVLPRTYVGIGRLGEAGILERAGVDGVLLPLNGGALALLQEAADRLAGKEERVVWRIPAWLGEKDTERYREAVGYLAGRGFRRFEANNLSHFPLLALADHWIVAGWRLNATNVPALRSLRAMGAQAAVLSPEDDGANMDALLRADLPIERWVFLAGRVPLMVSRIPILPEGGKAGVASGRGDFYELCEEDGSAVLSGKVPFSITEHRARLAGEGADAFVVEAAGLEEGELDRLLSAAAEGLAVTGSTCFNFGRGDR